MVIATVLIQHIWSMIALIFSRICSGNFFHSVLIEFFRFVESETMNLLGHFKNYELNTANYAATEDVVFYNESTQPLMKKYSKHNNPDFWNENLFCKYHHNDDKSTIDFETLRANFNAENLSVNEWVSEKREKMFDGYNDEGNYLGKKC